jgi:multidrug efflux pump
VRFNTWFDTNADRYQRAVKVVIRHMRKAMLVYAGLVLLLMVVFLRLPTSFLPVEDQGAAQLQFTLPPGATQGRTLAAAKVIERYFLGQEKHNIGDMFMVLGGNQAGSGQNAGRGFLHFAPWDERKGKENTAQSIVRRATQQLSNLRDVQFFALNPPPVRGLGQSSGFTMELENTARMSRQAFKAAVDAIDAEKAGALGLSQAEVDSTLTAAWGGNYIGDFVDRGRVKRVFVQGDAAYRSRPEDLASWFVRSSSGAMAPFSAFAHVDWSKAPTTLTRFNGLPSYEIQGDAAEGRSTGEAMNHMAAIVAKHPGISVEWSGLSYQERLSGGQAPILYAISLLVVFLCLAALYESWSVPFSVLLVIPLGLVGAALAVALRGLSNDVYFQVGLLTTMGLSAKNAILIVEFAEAAEKNGLTTLEAALEAARLRLRPILMTSLAFIAGVFPLAIATGAGAQSRIAIGTAVIGGMLTATVLAIFFVPMFFVLVRRMFRSAHVTAAEQLRKAAE